MLGTSLSFTILFLCLNHAHQHKIADVQTSESDNHFDMLVFLQHWPVTICKDWMHRKKYKECAYPNQKNQWTVLGIWPRTVEWVYPQYCNNSWVFDPKEIKSIQGELEQAWTDIHKVTDPYSFWTDVWQKHGTCATELEDFNSQFKYFSKGIEWQQKYSLLDMFNAAKIFPSDSEEYTPEQFANAVKAITNKNPMVGCNTIDEVLYLEEMHICFDKELNVIDCVHPVAGRYCDFSKGIILPANA